MLEKDGKVSVFGGLLCLFLVFILLSCIFFFFYFFTEPFTS